MGFRMCILAVILVAVLAAGAVRRSGESQRGSRERSLTVLGREVSDGRYAAIRAAIEFWDREFKRMEMPAPFAAPRFLPQPVPEALLRAYSAAVLERQPWPAEPNPLSAVPGDVVIVLSDSAIVSFSAPLERGERALIGLRTGSLPPLSLPNVARNVVAHELGHVLGLAHNGDPALLMCGRPAACRPSDFRSAEPRFFGVADVERDRLRALHGGR